MVQVVMVVCDGDDDGDGEWGRWQRGGNDSDESIRGPLNMMCILLAAHMAMILAIWAIHGLGILYVGNGHSPSVVRSVHRIVCTTM